MMNTFRQDEQERLRALESYDLLDTSEHGAFEDLARIAAQICQTPIALVTLVDASHQWLKARHGLDLDGTPREHSFCAHAIQSPELFIVRDAFDDPRFADNPLVVDDPRIRFYAGSPLVTP